MGKKEQDTIDACDYILAKVKPNENFEFSIILKDFVTSQSKIVPKHIVDALKDAELRVNRDIDYIQKFMLDEGYVELYKQSTTAYILTNGGRIAKIIRGHNKYQKYLNKQQWALVRHPAFLYKTRYITYTISAIALLATIYNYVYTVSSTNENQQRYDTLEKSQMKSDILIDSLRELVVPSPQIHNKDSLLNN